MAFGVFGELFHLLGLSWAVGDWAPLILAGLVAGNTNLVAGVRSRLSTWLGPSRAAARWLLVPALVIVVLAAFVAFILVAGLSNAIATGLIAAYQSSTAWLARISPAIPWTSPGVLILSGAGIGAFLFQLKHRRRVIYGYLELFVATVSMAFAIRPGPMLPSVLAFSGGIYVFVRGLDNLREGASSESFTGSVIGFLTKSKDKTKTPRAEPASSPLETNDRRREAGAKA